MLDDAHGIGVMGANGRGTAEHYNCLGQIDILLAHSASHLVV